MGIFNELKLGFFIFVSYYWKFFGGYDILLIYIVKLG